MPETILDNDFALTQYYSELSLLKIVWKNKPLMLEDYQNVYLNSLTFQQTHPVYYTLSDITAQNAIPAEYTKWFNEYVLPTAKRQGAVRLGIIITGNVLKMLYINTALNISKQFGISMKAFKTESAALAWLIEEAPMQDIPPK